MHTRALLMVSAVLWGCGAPEPSATTTAPTDPAPSAAPAAASDPAPVASGSGDRCEGLVGACGGWLGCVMVRVDPTGPGRFVGVGPNAGHIYDENHDCNAGVCNELCGGGSESVCRPGLSERVPDMACSEAIPPSRAPFSCWLQDGACVQGPDPAMMPSS